MTPKYPDGASLSVAEALEEQGRDIADLAEKLHEAERRAAQVAPLMEALAWALPYADEHAERGSQCCGAPQHSEVEGICAQCRDHTGFDNPDLEHAKTALTAARKATP